MGASRSWKRPGDRPSPRASRRSQSHQHLDFSLVKLIEDLRTPAFRSAGKHVWAVLSDYISGICDANMPPFPHTTLCSGPPPSHHRLGSGPRAVCRSPHHGSGTCLTTGKGDREAQAAIQGRGHSTVPSAVRTGGSGSLPGAQGGAQVGTGPSCSAGNPVRAEG